MTTALNPWGSVESLTGQIAAGRVSISAKGDDREGDAGAKRETENAAKIPKHIIVYTSLLSLIGFTIGIQAAAFFGGLTTIEKAFQFTSTQMGFANAMFVVGFAGSQPLWSYYGDKMHKPLLYAFGLYIVEVSNVIPILMTFRYVVPMELLGHISNGSSTATTLLTCLGRDEFAVDSTNDSGIVSDPMVEPYDNYIPYVLYSLWSAVFGVGFAPQFSLALTHIDDYVERTSSAFMMSIPTASFSIGPIIGFVFCGQLLQIHHDFSTPPYDSSDSRWIGNWWIMYPAMGFVACVVVTGILFIPKHEKRTLESKEYSLVDGKTSVKNNAIGEEDNNNNRNSENNLENRFGSKERRRSRKESAVETFKSGGVSLLTSFRNIFRSKAYILILVANCFSAFAFVGFDYFLIKILAVQFQKDPTASNDIFSGVSFCAACAVVLGGYISKRFEFSLERMIFIQFLIACYQFVLIAIMIFTKCEKKEFQGLSFYPGPSTGLPQLNLTASCNADCSCPPIFQPVCGVDNRLYYSPCVAGCGSVLEDALGQTLANCSCIPEAGTAMVGFCEETCVSEYFYITIVVLLRFGSAFGRIYLFASCIMSVAEESKTLALGFRSMCGSLFGDVGSSLILGLVIDLACLSWANPSTENGNCWFYDSDRMHFWFHILPLAAVFIGGSLFFWAWRVARRQGVAWCR